MHLFYTYSFLILCTEILILMYVDQILPKFSHRILGWSGLELSFWRVLPCKVSPNYKFVAIFKKNVDDVVIWNVPFNILYNTIGFFTGLNKEFAMYYNRRLGNSELSNMVIRLVSFTNNIKSLIFHLTKKKTDLYFIEQSQKKYIKVDWFSYKVSLYFSDFHPKKNV